jgi:hypothetical protein
VAYDPAEPTAVDRVRGRVGDTADPPQLRGGEGRYQAILAAAGGDEPAATRAAAAALAAQLAQDPDQVSDASGAVRWGARIAQLNRIADGAGGATPAGSAPTAGAATGGVATEAVW